MGSKANSGFDSISHAETVMSSALPFIISSLSRFDLFVKRNAGYSGEAIQDSLLTNSDILAFMNATGTTHIVALDRMHDGLFIFFADGRSAFYSDFLLHSLLDLAKAISKES